MTYHGPFTVEPAQEEDDQRENKDKPKDSEDSAGPISAVRLDTTSHSRYCNL